MLMSALEFMARVSARNTSTPPVVSSQASAVRVELLPRDTLEYWGTRMICTTSPLATV